MLSFVCSCLARMRCANRCIVIAAALAALLTDVAGAADKPVASKAPSMQSCAADWWRGWYLGLNFAGVGYTAHRTDEDGQLINVASYTQKQTGFLGGAQGGYNWTSCNALFGIEIDGSAGSVNASTGLLPNTANADVSITSRFNDLITARARTGIALDNLLLYLSGGVAAVHTLITYLNLASDQFTFSDWRWGWVAGAGAELAVTTNISLRSELLYVGVADRTYTFVSPTLGIGNFAHSDSMWIGRVGLNVKLGFDPAIPTY